LTTATIEEVLARMDERLERAVRDNDPHGHFTAVYRAVTARVRDGLDADEFDDADRMERFDVVFAELYLEAAERWDRGERVSASWEAAFARSRDPLLVLQHVLLGMNAHINLDLGVAAARTVPGTEIADLEDDFERMNDVLADMVDRMQDAIASVSPWTAVVDRIGMRADELISSWSISYARSRAWRFAQELAVATDPDDLVGLRDRSVAAIGDRIARPSLPVRTAVSLVRRLERADVGTVARALRARGAPVPEV
jgi:hypothetical protein